MASPNIKNVNTKCTKSNPLKTPSETNGGNQMRNGINGPEEKQTLRRGKWTPEEEAYANRLIIEFKAGLLPLTDGTTLRTFLSKLLNCDPMRISKKFVGENCIGKQVFRRRQADIDRLTAQDVERSRYELSQLERKFLDRVTQTNRSKTNGQIGRQNHSLGPVAPEIIRHHVQTNVPLGFNIKNGQNNNILEMNRPNIGCNITGLEHSGLDINSFGGKNGFNNFGKLVFGNPGPNQDFNVAMAGQFPNLGLPFNPNMTGGRNDNDDMMQGFPPTGEAGKFPSVLPPKKTAAWMLPPGPAATSAINIDFVNCIMKETMDNNKISNQESQGLRGGGGYTKGGPINSNESKGKAFNKNGSISGKHKGDMKADGYMKGKSSNDLRRGNLGEANTVPPIYKFNQRNEHRESKDGNPWNIIHNDNNRLTQFEHGGGYNQNFGSDYHCTSPVVNGTQNDGEYNILSPPTIHSNSFSNGQNNYAGVMQSQSSQLQMQGRLLSDSGSQVGGRPRSYTGDSFHSITSNFVTSYSPRLEPSAPPMRNLSGQDTSLNGGLEHSIMGVSPVIKGQPFTLNSTPFENGNQPLLSSSSGRISSRPTTPKCNSLSRGPASSQNLQRVGSTSDFFALSPAVSSENLQGLDHSGTSGVSGNSGKDSRYLSMRHSHTFTKSMKPNLPPRPTMVSSALRNTSGTTTTYSNVNANATSNLPSSNYNNMPLKGTDNSNNSLKLLQTRNVQEERKFSSGHPHPEEKDSFKTSNLTMNTLNERKMMEEGQESRSENKSCEKFIEKSNSALKRTYSDSASSSDPENDENSRCLSISSNSSSYGSGSGSDQVKNDSVLKKDESNLPSNSNSGICGESHQEENRLHNLHAIATECNDLLDNYHVQKKHKSL